MVYRPATVIGESMRYFVILKNPSNNAYFAMVKDENQELALFNTIDEAGAAATANIFGAAGYYSIFDILQEVA